LDLHGEKVMGGHWKEQSILKDKFPEIEISTALFRASQWLEFEGIPVETSCFFVDSTFYDIFDFRLIRGNRSTVLDNPSGIVVTENMPEGYGGTLIPLVRA
ncbi:MAG: hypothetical protein K2K37_07010, partial [Muribaculaceae bacterium]|nr:hypothetical protein [Muribaculaceae bacterium]